LLGRRDPPDGDLLGDSRAVTTLLAEDGKAPSDCTRQCRVPWTHLLWAERGGILGQRQKDARVRKIQGVSIIAECRWFAKWGRVSRLYKRKHIDNEFVQRDKGERHG
jgi:hypothetical protein